jgi:hypothetical protein
VTAKLLLEPPDRVINPVIDRVIDPVINRVIDPMIKSEPAGGREDAARAGRDGGGGGAGVRLPAAAVLRLPRVRALLSMRACARVACPCVHARVAIVHACMCECTPSMRICARVACLL